MLHSRYGPGAGGGGEPINLNATLTVTLTERPATAVLDEITRKTGIKFAYDPEDIRRLPAVSGEFKKVTVHELLDKCIAGSTFKYAIENNVVLVDKEKCIGCKYCMAACPYGARIVQEKTGVVEKCRFCWDGEKPGNPPACVGTCISGARIFGDLDDPDSEINQAIAKYHAQPLADNLTVSKIYYVR